VSRRWPQSLAALLATLAALGPGSSPASAGELRAVEEGAWHAERDFELEWQPLPPPGQPREAVLRLYDPQGNLLRTLSRPLGDLLDPFKVPPQPGAYSLEGWLQDEAGGQGPHATATLRFDDTAPPPPALRPPAGWVLGVEPAGLEIEAASTPPPLAGVRGYAVSVDRGSGSSPCASPSRCGAGEIDLTGASGSVSLGTLPEGVNFVRAVAVSGAGVASAVETAEVRVDGSAPLVSLHGVPAAWSDGPVKLTALATDPLSGMAAAGYLGPLTAIAVDGAPARRALGDTVTTSVSGSGIHEIEYFARDAAGNVADGRAGRPQPAKATVRIDEDPPAVAFAGAQDPAEPERLEALVADSLSGPSPDRGWIGVRPAGTYGRFEQLPTQVAESRLVARWDSDSYPPGSYEFLATGFDAAGNAGGGTNRTSGTKMVLANPLKTPVQLAARLSHRRLAGRLRQPGAGPIAGREIAVTETFAPGARPSRRTSFVRTRADGSFQVRLAPGPSREVVAAFAGTRTLTRAASESARLEVPTKIGLRASAASARVGGAPVVFRGKVGAAGTEPAALAGLPVELQFRFRSGRWSEFRTVEADRRGRFRYAYRFSDDDSRGVSFQFRAHVKGREGWPFEPGASRPVLITGR